MCKRSVQNENEPLVCPFCNYKHSKAVKDYAKPGAYDDHSIQDYECNNCASLIEFSVREDGKTFDIEVDW